MRSDSLTPSLSISTRRSKVYVVSIKNVQYCRRDDRIDGWYGQRLALRVEDIAKRTDGKAEAGAKASREKCVLDNPHVVIGRMTKFYNRKQNSVPLPGSEGW
jgi:hypothetical protein